MVGNEGLGIGGFRAKVPVVEEVDFGRMFLSAFQFRIVYERVEGGSNGTISRRLEYGTSSYSG